MLQAVCGGGWGHSNTGTHPWVSFPAASLSQLPLTLPQRWKHSHSCTEEGTAFLKSLVPVVERVRERVLLRLPPAPPHHLPAFDWSHRRGWPRTGHRNGTSNSVCLPSAASWANCEQNPPVWCSLVEREHLLGIWGILGSISSKTHTAMHTPVDAFLLCPILPPSEAFCPRGQSYVLNLNYCA